MTRIFNDPSRREPPLRIRCLVHNALGGETHLPIWARQRGYEWTEVLIPEAVSLPTPADTDCLVVLGGPMSAWEEERHPWLRAEKRLLEAFVAAGRPVLGICLGAQLLAEVLGARAYRGPRPEIGWFDVEATPQSQAHWLGELLPAHFQTFLWHGDTFDMPAGAVHLAHSRAYPHQAFAWERVLALQFHLETRPDWVGRLVARDIDQLVTSQTVQCAEAILATAKAAYRANNRLMERLLDRWLASALRA
jgi:GMP synthase-like glutamine amidotransferase